MTRSLAAAFLAEVGLITYRSVSRGIKVPAQAPLPAPLPSVYASAILFYGVLSLAPGTLAPIPSLIGWGIVVATLLNLWEPGGAAVRPAATTGTVSAADLPQPAKVSVT